MAPDNDFHIGDDGELVIPETGMAQTGEQPEVDSVTSVLTTPKFTKKSESTEVPETKTETPFTNADQPTQTTVDTIQEPTVDSELRNENAALNQRIAALEARLNQETEEASRIETEEKARDFRSEIASAISDIFGDFIDDEKKEKLVGVIEKVADQKSQVNKGALDNFIKANDQAGKEIRQVLTHYDGQNGKPTIMQMKPLTDWIANRFGSDVLANFPGVTVFRAAENIPFILWLEEKYPQQTKQMSFEQFCIASEEVRKAYYKGKNIHPYSHLESYLRGNNTANSDTNNREELRRTADNLAETPRIGLAAENSSIVRREKTPPTSAREAVERTLAELGIT